MVRLDDDGQDLNGVKGHVSYRFTAELHAAGMRVTLRRNRGRDIDAACGQLAALV